MPFGLCNAPRTFQRIMQNISGRLNYLKIFLDDILIHSSNEEDHVKHVKTIIDILHVNEISINFEKSSFGLEKVRYLGIFISIKEYKRTSPE